MKLNKKLEAEVTKVYDTWLYSYLNGDVKAYDSYLDKDYHFIGSTNNEDFLTRKETTKFFKTTAEQLAGKCQIKNNIRIIEKFDELVFITERFDANFLIEKKWVYYGKFRFSSVMHKKAEGWRFIYQHFSMPDSKAQDGETLGAEQVSKENQELRDAIKRRTAELEIKNKELEIETSLEKVRAVAMGMHKPDDMLGVCKILFQELQSLGFDELRNTLIHSFPEGKEYFINYDYSLKTGGLVAQIPVKGNASIEKFVKAIHKSANAFHHLLVKGNELKDWIAFRKANKEPNDPRLNKIDSLHYYNYSVGTSGIGISTYSSITKEKQDLLQRFRNVFQLAYQRYTDITLAEAQVREAQIEASLERVRSRSLAMHNTSELQEVIHTVHRELLHLNIAINGGSFIAINSDIETTLRCWGSGGTADTTEEIHIPLYKKSFCTNLINRIKKGPGFLTEAFTQKEKKDFFTFLFNHEPWKKLKAKQKNETLLSPGGYSRSCYVSKHTSIFIINQFGEKFSADDNDILQRFGKVFEQSYTRFLDLQKAEAQAREAEIELALERVRARTMAMQHSDELREVVVSIYEQLQLLNFDSNACNIIIYDRETGDNLYWVSGFSQELYPLSYKVPFINHRYYKSQVADWKKGSSYSVIKYSGKTKKEFDKIWFSQTDFKNVPAKPKAFMIGLEAVTLSTAYFKYGALQALGPAPLTDENANTLQRLSKVFEQTYTRFLDLQKAEAQTREAEIELALERVRARTMAMQHSDELAEVVGLLYRQFNELDFGLYQILVSIIDIKNNVVEWWSRGFSEMDLPQRNLIPIIDHPFPNTQMKKWESGTDYYAHVLAGDNKKSWEEYLFTQTDLKNFPKQVKDRMRSLEQVYLSDAFMKYGVLQAAGPSPLADEKADILKRFAKVLDLAYTRMMDLLNAEAQTREAQIELGLERVRARAMAMQHSNELSQLVDTVFKELANLDFALSWCIINIIDEPSLTNMVWAANPETNKPPESYLMKFEDYPFHHSMMKGYQERKTKHVYILEGKEKKEYDKYLFNKTEWRRVPQKAQAASKAMKRYVASFTFSNFGGLQTVGEEPLSIESLDILHRFGKVFDGTYTRFNDLQKAEAQAREADIELSLERVRARTMSMHNSTDVGNTAIAMFDELVHLGVNKSVRCGIGIFDETKFMEVWTVSFDKKNSKALNIGKLDMTLHPMLTQVKKSWENKKSGFIYELKGKDLRNYFLAINKQKDYPISIDMDILPERVFHNDFRFSEGVIYAFTPEPLSAEMNQIFKRFAGVFEQTYRRFLDLQKAEAQTREAEIELALERVRARTMAMQRSEELADVSLVLFQQVEQLGIKTWATGFNIWLEGNTSYIDWVVNSATGRFMEPYTVDLTAHPLFFKVSEAKKRRDNFFVLELAGESLVESYRLLFKMAKLQFEQVLESGFQMPTRQINHYVFGSNVSLMFITFEPYPEAWDIFKRFGKVFEQTYTRFLDLQKAETQVREAQINLAVERVRARALAMFKSEEILGVVFKLKEEVMNLNIPGVVAATIHLKEKNGLHRMWDLSSAEQDGESMHLPLDIIYKLEDTDPSLYIRKVWKNTKQYFLVKQDKKDLKITTAWLRSNGKFKEADEADQFVDGVDFSFLYHPTIQLNNGRMSIDLLDHLPPPEMESILIKMGAAFDLAYKRFEDLQKAEAQAKEAGIELALERVRSQAMAMQKSYDLLDIVVTMRTEFTRLGYEAHYFWHMMWLPEKYEKAMTSGDGTKIGFVMELPRHIHGDIPLLAKWEKSKEPTVVYAMNVEEALDYVYKMESLGDFQNIDPQAPSHDDIRHINGLTFVMARTTHGEIGFSLPGVVENPPKEDVDILIRFAGAFDIAHRRFLDLQKSEAQSREVEIELALEKVRSRSMGMQKSEELKEVIQVVYDEFVQLKINVEHTGFIIDYKANDDMHIWLADRHKVPAEVTLPYFDCAHWNSFVDAKKNGKEFFANHLSFEEKNKFYQDLFKLIPGLPEETLEYYFSCAGLAISTVLIDNVGLYIENFSGTPYSEEENKILMRFGKVFEQTYTRFLDLQKAEASAREAKIEAALEKVRSRSLAMHKSDELSEVILEVQRKFQELNISMESRVAVVVVFDKKSRNFNQWVASPDFSNIYISTPYFQNPILDDFWTAKERGVDFYSKAYSFEIKNSYFKYFFEKSNYENIEGLEEQKKWLFEQSFYTYSPAFEKNSSIGIADFSGTPLSESDIEIIKRFAKVFEQAYVRFMDLQKAEAQAREAQIEAALEKIRAASLSMHSSDDLINVVTVLRNQMGLLNHADLESSIIHLYKENSDTFEAWWSHKPSSGSQIITGVANAPVNSLWAKEVLRNYKSESEIYLIESQGEMLKEWYDVLTRVAPEVVKYDKAGKIVVPDILYYHFAKFSGGALLMITESEPSNDAIYLQKRAATVFNVAYQRFLDLQKAEAQAREAKIEAALERVRSRAMAMHKSDELASVVNVMFHEFRNLQTPEDLDILSRGFITNIYEEEKQFDLWVTDLDGNEIKQQFFIDVLEPTTGKPMYEAWVAKKPIFILDRQEEKLHGWLLYLESIHFNVPPEMWSSRRVSTFIYYSKGFIGITSFSPLSEGNIQVLLRFAKVFEQTYTRFLDLQKAEAQAREAQIEVALERIRARALAMHSSNELMEVANILREQMGLLDQPDLETSVVNLLDVDLDNIDSWHAFREPGLSSGKIIQGTVTFRKDSSELSREMVANYHSGKKEFTLEATGEKLNEFIRVMIDAQPKVLKYIAKNPPDKVYYHFATFTGGALLTVSYQPPTEDIRKLQRRAASVFDMAYRRYLDLKKVEAQAREAKIELGLERVRARAMAMQQSDELKELIGTVYAELSKLNISLDRCLIWVMNSEDYSTKLWMASTGSLPVSFYVPYHENPPYLSFVKGWKERNSKWEYDLGGQIKKDWDEFVFNNTEMKYLPEAIKKGMQASASIIMAGSFQHFGCLQTAGPETLKEEQFEVLNRFAQVFDSTYTRFNDLQKAEAQAREAKIEVSLERIRSRAMAMHKTDELLDAGELVYKELTGLGITSMAVSYAFVNEQKKNALYYGINPVDGKIPPAPFIFPHTETEEMRSVLKSWKNQEAFKMIELDEEATLKHQTWVGEHIQTILAKNNIPFSVDEFLAVSPHTAVIYTFHFKQGYIFIIGEEHLSAMQEEIVLRFTKVFEMTYRRFLDLQKAEAQAREAKIEAALERTRTQSMIMQHSKELDDTLRVFHEQVLLLGINSAFSYLWLPDEEKEQHVFWAAWAEQQNGSTIFKSKALNYPLDRNEPATAKCLVDWKSDEPVHSYTLLPDEVENYFTSWAALLDGVEKLKPEHFPGGLYYVEAYMKYGCFGIMIKNELSEEEKKILGRFSIEFERTYTRFLDLQKAEAQIREAQIEGALERVRSKSMAMHHSENLHEVINTLTEQLQQLGFSFDTANFITDYTKDGMYMWVSTPGVNVPSRIYIPLRDLTFSNILNNAVNDNLDFISYNLSFEEKNDFFRHFFENTDGKYIPEERKQYIYNSPGISASVVLLKNVFLTIANYQVIPYTEDENSVFKRFGNVFGQSYTRFLDLQKAEAQAREAKIEMALEKIRSRTMAMQHSDELPEAANLLFLEVQALGIPAWSAGYNILSEDKKSCSCIMSSEGILQQPFKLHLTGENSFIEMYEFLKSEENFMVQELGGKELEQHYGYMKSFPELKDTFQHVIDSGLSLPTYQINHLIKYTQGFLLFITYEKVPDAHDIFKRFTKVFEQTYTRFLDLKKSEAQTRQAQIEVALERVRARALAMQQPEELKEVAEVLRQEMGLLGVEELETCSIYINDENAEQAECWYALKDLRSEEKKLVNDHFALNLNDTWVGREMLSFYNSDEKQISILMAGANRVEWIRFCEASSAPFRGYYGDEIPDRTYHLYKFSHGAIGAAAAGDISKESWNLLRRAASVFSLAYSRFKDLTQARIDLQRLKEEKQRAEDALTNLQAAQKQLVQSEKMASLGELTAGIAHEIQNPLNFVNNFSEVSKELLDEMREAIEKGDTEDAKEIMNDVIQNLEKINHHGKRADGIVKGMLQHSRSSSGTKEPTDINALADEYLRLAYHGLRAKDKSFNATMKTDFDTSLEKVNVITQDIGRVILNLITNAFYVVNEKKHQHPESDYEPTVTIKTTSIHPPSGSRSIQIKVSDNGGGISQKVLDKIFQPFFTTKPTGQGTGLGLSLAFDIVTKGHGGELKVETKVGEGTEFVIVLPV